jgi:hypothetical protein
VRHKPWHAHSGGDFDIEVVVIADGVNAADTEASIGGDFERVAGLRAE